MKKRLVCLFMITLAGCGGLSYQQQQYLGNAQQKAAQLERESQEQQKKTAAIREYVARLDRLPPDLRLDYELSQMNQQTAETYRNTAAGKAVACALGLQLCD